MSNKSTVKLSDIRLESGTTNSFFVTWTFSKKNLDKFEVQWEYYAGNKGVWFKNKSDSQQKISTYSPPANAKKIRVKVHAVAKTHKVKKENKTVTVHYWNEGWTDYKDKPVSGGIYIPAPSSPTVEIKKQTLKATVDWYDATVNKVNYIEFHVVEDGAKEFQTARAKINFNMASFSCTINPGHEYKVQARAVRSASTSKKLSEDLSLWSEYASPVSSGAGSISGTPIVVATGPDQVKLTWNAAPMATGYDIEYTRKPEYFDHSSSEVQSETVPLAATSWYISGLDNTPEEGETESATWFFRIRATSDSGEPGAWSRIVSTAIGTVPDAPTTWSYTINAKIGEDVVLNWAHSSKDGSYQKAAKIGIIVNGGTETYIDISGDASSYKLNTNSYSDGTVLKWRVQTKGTMPSYGAWSTQRQVTLYLPPTVSVGLYERVEWLWDPFNFTTDNIYTAIGDGVNPLSVVRKFPFVLAASAAPETQHAISFVVTIVSNESYDTTDGIGVFKRVVAGEEIFSQYIEAREGYNQINVMFSPSNLDLENNVSYTAHVYVAMDSGLDAEGYFDFTVEWDEVTVEPNATVTINWDDYSCYILPFCTDEEGEDVTDVTFGVYRRMYDGSFVEIMSDIDGAEPVTVVDPHPSLDYARYRIVATSKETGSIDFMDIPGIPMLYTSVVIQWDESWTEFDYDSEFPEVTPPWSGSLLTLPYNIDIQASHSPDVALVEYIGRANPVSYYGTQKGETGQWTVEIPKDDTETLYQIRRLAAYSGDCYVREPSGIGYWANVTVSYNESHNKPVVPVTLAISRVEGGV